MMVLRGVKSFLPALLGGIWGPMATWAPFFENKKSL
jgi:hypothetical protein